MYVVSLGVLAQFQFEQLIAFQCSALPAVSDSEGACFVFLSKELLTARQLCLPPQRRGVSEVVRELPASLWELLAKWSGTKGIPVSARSFTTGRKAIHHSSFEPLLRPEQNGKRLCFLEELFLNVVASFEALSKGWFYFVFVFLKSIHFVSPPTRLHTAAWHHAHT